MRYLVIKDQNSNCPIFIYPHRRGGTNKGGRLWGLSTIFFMIIFVRGRIAGNSHKIARKSSYFALIWIGCGCILCCLRFVVFFHHLKFWPRF